MKHSSLLAKATSFLCALTCAVSSAQPLKATAFEEKLQQFDSVIDSVLSKSDSEKASAIERSYRELFENESAQAQANRSAKDLSLGFRAASQAAFYTLDERYIDDMSHYLKALEARRQATPAQFAAMYGALVQTRNLDAAQALYSQHANPEMEPLPRREQMPATQKGPREWSISEQGVLSLKLHPARAAEIIVISHPSCDFTRRAVQDLKEVPGGSASFFRGAHWLTPQDRRFKVDVLRSWNQQHPDARMSIVYKEKEWRGLDAWSTPTFYFIKDGRVVRKIVGWPGPERVRDVIDAAREIGISDAR
ncbi:hypothetical protein GLA29479_836 [Lysobacter antibioticus]|uniref:hypothetical protein n=1 Tax=Lysobacter antibioticus TaxID=84531 RepID=UPI000716FD6B|nr:hypothetical protein [Lysobacter antibioticus]ALN61720.1 hypothetical protein GLA29479_836 [Lysobacter antibioticus]